VDGTVPSGLYSTGISDDFVWQLHQYDASTDTWVPQYADIDGDGDLDPVPGMNVLEKVWTVGAPASGVWVYTYDIVILDPNLADEDLASVWHWGYSFPGYAVDDIDILAVYGPSGWEYRANAGPWVGPYDITWQVSDIDGDGDVSDDGMINSGLVYKFGLKTYGPPDVIVPGFGHNGRPDGDNPPDGALGAFGSTTGPTPEPCSGLLLVTSGAALFALLRRRRE
jgi:hypothetical protein